MPDLTPAPGSTANSAPNIVSFLTVSGVAATRGSARSLSRATLMRIHTTPLTHNAPSTVRMTVRSGKGVEQQGEGGNRHHAQADGSRSGPSADTGRDNRGNQDNGSR